ncbi:MAG: alpha-amylase [Parcubacteria group bacterium]|nr:alpha-amylase [Parcubacteria group bacterium]
MDHGNNHWWENAVLYELYVDKFAGTFKGLTAKLDYLQALGVSGVHLLPFYPSPMIDDGYDVSDYENIRSNLGRPEDFEEFAKQAHRRGIRILIDLVLNHVSSEHPWFVAARKSLDNPYRRYFLWSKSGKEFDGAVNPFKHLKPNNWIYNPATEDYYFTTFYPEQPDLNWDNAEVLEEIFGIMDFWVKRGADGFRLDAVSHIIKREGTSCKHLPEVHQIIKKLRAHIETNYPHAALLAEVTDMTVEKVKEYFGKGDECQMVYHFIFTEALLYFLISGNQELLIDTLRKSAGLPEHCRWAVFLTDHDSVALEILPQEERRKLLAFLDPNNKYEFGKDRGASMRLANLFRGNKNRILDAFRLLLSFPGTPVIYYGEEIGMRNDDLKEPPRDTRRYVRGNFDWKETERQMADKDSLFAQVMRMIRERKMHPGLVSV